MRKKNIKILIVEDETLIALLLKRNLQLVGYTTCEPVASGEAAIQAAGAEQLDVVLMDIRLVGSMDGIEAAQDIMARYHLPVIFMTGYSDPQIMARAKALPGAAYLVKPITPDHLEPVLVALFGKDE